MEVGGGKITSETYRWTPGHYGQTGTVLGSQRKRTRKLTIVLIAVDCKQLINDSRNVRIRVP